jgi:hypothetical protein
VLSREKLVDWTLRHEMGHSVDEQIQFMPKRGRLNIFGGWRMHDNNREDEVAKAFLAKAGFTDAEQDKKGKGQYSASSLRERAAGHLRSQRDQIITNKLEAFAAVIAKTLEANVADVKPKLQAFDDAAAVAAAHPWTFADGGATGSPRTGACTTLTTTARG